MLDMAQLYLEMYGLLDLNQFQEFPNVHDVYGSVYFLIESTVVGGARVMQQAITKTRVCCPSTHVMTMTMNITCRRRVRYVVNRKQSRAPLAENPGSTNCAWGSELDRLSDRALLFLHLIKSIYRCQC